MVTADARNSRRFNVSFPCHASGIFHRHARPFSLYPPMPYSQASDHSVADGLKKTMLLIRTPLVVTCLRNFIHSWRYWICHSWSLCGPHFSPFVSKWRSRFKKYRAGGMTCAAWLSFPINYSRVSVLIFVEANASFMPFFQAVCFSSGRDTLLDLVMMTQLRRVFLLAGCPYPASFLNESGSSCFRSSDGYSGRNSVWMTNRAALFARSIHC